MDSIAWFFLLLRHVIVILPAVAVLAAPLGFALGYRLARVRWYYRGMYDACQQGYNTTDEICLMAVRGAYDQGYHAQPSPGWQWPLPPPPRWTKEEIEAVKVAASELRQWLLDWEDE